MLTDPALKSLKFKDKPYKVTDRDGMYVLVAPSGNIAFRLDYRLNDRRETVTFGRYGRDGISLANAREKCIDAKRAIREGRSPAIEKQREKRRIKEAKSFGEFGEKWLTAGPMADSTRAMRRSIFERELLPIWRNRLLQKSRLTISGRIAARSSVGERLRLRSTFAIFSSRFTALRSCMARKSPIRPTR